MRKLLITIGLCLSATAAYAACTTQTFTYNGKTVMCTTCCTGTNCNTVCL